MTPQCLFYMGSWVLWCILTDWLSVVWSSHPSKCCPMGYYFHGKKVMLPSRKHQLSGNALEFPHVRENYIVR